jgi:geranylgeranyl transferase type-2 subunit beta
MMPYFADLALRLASGLENLPPDARERHAAFLAAAQRDDGGFAGRQGTSDPYYTSFGLRATAMLGQLSDTTAQRAAEFLTLHLKQHAQQPLGSADFLSLVLSAVLLETAADIDVFAAAGVDRRQAMTSFVEGLRRPDGGYAKSDRGGAASTYHTFLVTACRQLVDAPPEDAPPLVELIRSRQRADGGFVEVAAAQQSGTNPTAAAIGLLKMLGALDGPTRAAATAFLAAMQNAEGGLRANARVPAADLLSTFTGLVALADLDALPTIDLGAARRFVASLEQPRGGFRAGAWDDAVDVEYTFYGLGALALLNA